MTLNFERRRMKNYLCLPIFLAFPLSIQAKTLDEFFAAHPNLNASVEVRMAVKSLASSMANVEAVDEGNPQPGVRGAELLRENGGDYADIALKKLAGSCSGKDSIYEASDFSKKTCDMVIEELSKAQSS